MQYTPLTHHQTGCPESHTSLWALCTSLDAAFLPCGFTQFSPADTVWEAQAPPAKPAEGKSAAQPIAKPAEVQLGESIGQRTVNPLDFIKKPVPLLSSEKHNAPKRALGALEAAAAKDQTCVWQRVRPVHVACGWIRTGGAMLACAPAALMLRPLWCSNLHAGTTWSCRHTCPPGRRPTSALLLKCQALLCGSRTPWKRPELSFQPH